MDNEAYDNFRKIIELSCRFVEKHNGFWNHEDWLDFLTLIGENTVPMNDNMEVFLGSIVESMRDFYKHLDNTIAVTNTMMNMAEHTIRLITDTKGVWDNVKWDNFLTEYQGNKILFDLRDEAISNLQRVFNSSNTFYQALFNIYGIKTITNSIHIN